MYKRQGIGRIGKLTLWNHLNLRHFDSIVINAGRQIGKRPEDIIHYLTKDSTYGSINRFLFGYTGKSCEITIEDEEDCIFKINGITAVSYTHLDVYKRQPIYTTN